MFVAELLDLKSEHEPWRQAAELLLGGFARTLLVDRQHRSFRRTLDTLRFSRRINFELVDGHMPLVDLDETILPGRLSVDESSPYAGWLTAELRRNWAFECLDTPEFPDDNGRRITITGQVQNGRRGSHGGHGQPRILGYSTQDRIDELTAEKEGVDADLDRLGRSVNDVTARAARTEKVKDASGHLLGLNWTQLDATAASNALNEAKQRHEALTASSDTLRELQKQAVKLHGELDRARDTEVRQRDRDKHERELCETLVDAEDRTSDEIDALEAAGIVVTSEQRERLDTDYFERAKAGTSDELGTCVCPFDTKYSMKRRRMSATCMAS